jgi:hypothetical protein
MDICFRLLTDSDLPAVVALNKAQYGSDFFTDEKWFRWRFFKGDKDSFLIGSFDGDRLVGLTGLTIAPYYCNETICRIGLTESSLVNPEFRHHLLRRDDGLKSIFQVLLEEMHKTAIARHCDAIIGFPNPSSFPVFTGQFEYSHPGNLDFAFMPISSKAIAGFMSHPVFRKLRSLLPIADAFYRMIKIRNRKSRFTCEKIDSPVHGAPFQAGFTLQRTQQYLHWRLATNPAGYECCGCHNGDRPAGCCYWKTSLTLDRESGRQLLTTKIVDLWVDETRGGIEAASALLGSVRESAQKAGSAFVFSSMITNNMRRRWFTRNGFIWMKNRLFTKKIHIVTKKLGAVELPPLSQWHIGMLDNDII